MKKFEQIIKILANLSQVLMLVIVVWGYFYTVVPVFQKEKLSEDVAKLEIEKSKWQKEIDQYKGEIRNSKQEIIEQNKVKNDLNSNLSSMRAESSAISRKLSRAEEQLYEQQKLKLQGNSCFTTEYSVMLNKITKRFNDRLFFNDHTSIAKGLRDDFVQPLDIAKEKIAEMEGLIANESSEISKKVQMRLLSEYKKGLQNNSHVLQCPEPNYKTWQNSYGNALAMGDSMSRQCIKNNWEENSCKASIKYTIKNMFSDKWNDVNKPCEQRVMDLSEIVLNTKRADQLLPFGDLSPPSSNEVQRAIEDMFNNARKKN